MERGATPPSRDEPELNDCNSPFGVSGGISEEPVDIDSDRELHREGVVGDWVENWPLAELDMGLVVGSGAAFAFAR